MFNKKRQYYLKKLSSKKSSSLINGISRYNSPPKLTKRNHPILAKFKKIIILTLLIIGIGITIHVIFFSSYFLINDIQISDENIENEKTGEKIKEKIKDVIGKNLIFLNKNNIETKILETYPEIEDIEIEKDYPSTIIIKFTEYPLVANIINESASIKKTCVVNSIGYVVKENMENKNLPYIRIKSDDPINPDTAAIESGKLKYILDAITYFEEKFGMRVIETDYKKIPRELHLLTERNFYIWLDMQKSAQEQLKKLKKALVKLDIFKENLEYIDLRIAGGNGDKIIYKRK